MEVTDELNAATTEKITEGVKEMKNGRSPGPGDIPAELIKCGDILLLKKIGNLMNRCSDQPSVQKQWKVLYVNSVYKILR